MALPGNLVLIDQQAIEQLERRICLLERQQGNSQGDASVTEQEKAWPPRSDLYGVGSAPLFLKSICASLPDFDIALDRSLRSYAFEPRLIGQVTGGNVIQRKNTVPDARARLTGYGSFCFVTHFHQKYLPVEPGRSGVYITPSKPHDGTAVWPRYEKLFVSTTPDRRAAAFYQYFGEYEITPGKALTQGQVAALDTRVLDYWARHISDGRRNHLDIRRRVLYRTAHGGREPSSADIEVMGDENRPTISDVLLALKTGQEKLYANGIHCVWYEPSFQLRLIALKDQEDEDSA
ncbi:hypothetical protein FA95DRAFT_1552313 [Auriscalpium vulgare]|uniref:Uncharacterized protein n=1 Tax=Auriscalpium vulgare TaxID=40419 RepID=A0ACB8SC73_9AGAM|nr:hypothetical protein FA95DRAFT_1552313 [Auriscalpium vulgare]